MFLCLPPALHQFCNFLCFVHRNHFQISHGRLNHRMDMAVPTHLLIISKNLPKGIRFHLRPGSSRILFLAGEIPVRLQYPVTKFIPFPLLRGSFDLLHPLLEIPDGFCKLFLDINALLPPFRVLGHLIHHFMVLPVTLPAFVIQCPDMLCPYRDRSYDKYNRTSQLDKKAYRDVSENF